MEEVFGMEKMFNQLLQQMPDWSDHLLDVTVSRHRAPFCPLVLRSADYAQEQDDLGGEAHE